MKESIILLLFILVLLCGLVIANAEIVNPFSGLAGLHRSDAETVHITTVNQVDDQAYAAKVAAQTEIDVQKITDDARRQREEEENIHQAHLAVIRTDANKHYLMAMEEARHQQRMDEIEANHQAATSALKLDLLWAAGYGALVLLVGTGLALAAAWAVRLARPTPAPVVLKTQARENRPNVDARRQRELARQLERLNRERKLAQEPPEQPEVYPFPDFLNRPFPVKQDTFDQR